MKPRLLIGLALVSVSLFLGSLFLQNKHSVELPELGGVPSFSLVDQDGNAFSAKELEGKVSILNFFFTRCHGPCPVLMKKMADLQDALIAVKDVRHLSITSDPDNDKPEQLKPYGENIGATAGRWFLLGGVKADIIALAKEAFKLPAGEDPDMHSTRFVLIDKKGQIRGYYDSKDQAALKKLETDASALAKL